MRIHRLPAGHTGARSPAGFTLLELLLVIGLMALFAGIYMGGLTSALPFEIRSSARAVSGDLEYAGQRATTVGELHRWVVDLDEQRFRIERLQETPPEGTDELPGSPALLDLKPPRGEREFVPLESRYGEWRALDQGDVWFDRVRVGDQELRRGVAGIRFSPDGGADPAQILLTDDGGRTWAVYVLGFTGEVIVEEVPDA
jgi:prepilin-type N-terminal cleavage/methylation domain-containing protein